ncbi:hypothetical protein [Archaeoglobus veneficus]|uniref:Uncharacterized protein n=1 Tax=Archaeoglobus veneficus (strain DSM 11195 / SNP6) TaxID=693661 RepID=F2KQK5_ARCVS|nr:hypothetical protein [Archaeoglobus veneficus]AEA47738.1 hypothetical protein Arcve_1740 [Archaeoglobus veneficus SNP6]
MLYKRTRNRFFRDIQEVLERPQKPTKKINTILIREPDVENVLKAIWNYPVPLPIKLKYIAGVLFAAYTGQRPGAYGHFRKFFEQMCNNVLTVQLPDGRVVPAVHPGLRDYIMAHNTGSLDVQSYDGKLPSEIYEQYMAAWKEVNLVPEGVRLEELVNLCKKY